MGHNVCIFSLGICPVYLLFPCILYKIEPSLYLLTIHTHTALRQRRYSRINVDCHVDGAFFHRPEGQRPVSLSEMAGGLSRVTKDAEEAEPEPPRLALKGCD